MEYTDVLKFWFEDLTMQDWYKKSDELDNKIQERFLPALNASCAGELYEWRSTPDGQLAEIILLDQFSRNIFRDTAAAFAQDEMALCLAQFMVQMGTDKEIPADKRSFIYMPYMHSESKIVHEKAMELFSQEGFEGSLKYEIMHKEIIDRFGRYPHRNEILGRESTPEEIEFLKQPNSSF